MSESPELTDYETVEDHDFIGILKRDPDDPSQLTQESEILLDRWEKQWRLEIQKEEPRLGPTNEEAIAHALRLAKIWEGNHFINRALDELQKAIDLGREWTRRNRNKALEEEIRARFKELAEHLRAKMIADGVNPD